MANPAHWVHDLDPIAFRLGGGLAVRWYALAYALSFIIWGLMLWWFRRKGKSPLTAEQEALLWTLLIFAVFLGGRLGFVVLHALGTRAARPAGILDFSSGGMASHGAFAAVALVGWCTARRFRVPTLRMADLLCPLAPPAFLLGRVANFINGEGWGRVSDAPWAVVFPLSAPPGTPIGQIAARHPAALYGAALEGLLLLLIIQWRFWRTPVLDRPGRLAGEFLVLYALARIACDFFRDPGPAILYTALLGLAGLALIGVSASRRDLRQSNSQ
jgi:phosphatidylglycerol---prolipoprotein diacylglyceryl transferase